MNTTRERETNQYTRKMNLSPVQKNHMECLWSLLETRGIAYDTSPTGSGKTIVAIKIAARAAIPLVVVAPRTLQAQWTETCRLEKIPLIFMGASSIQALNKYMKAYILVVDECHLFKNASYRTARLRTCISKARYTLFLSATPYDHIRQEKNISELIHTPIKDFYSICRQMDFKYPTDIQCSLYYVSQTEDEINNYIGGYSRIRDASREDENVPFYAGMFMSGLIFIHNSLISGLIRYVRHALMTKPNHKFIIALKFMQHFTEVEKHFGSVLKLRGETPMNARKSIIAAFQQPNYKHRILVLTDTVGGVGIDLDDQHGLFPRQIISLPLFTSDFCQLAGRIRRRNTKSDASIVIIQPPITKTYFKKQMNNKMKILKHFISDPNMHITRFKKQVEAHEDSCSTRLVVLLQRKLHNFSTEIVKEFACSCSFI